MRGRGRRGARILCPRRRCCQGDEGDEGVEEQGRGAAQWWLPSSWACWRRRCSSSRSRCRCQWWCQPPLPPLLLLLLLPSSLVIIVGRSWPPPQPAAEAAARCCSSSPCRNYSAANRRQQQPLLLQEHLDEELASGRLESWLLPLNPVALCSTCPGVVFARRRGWSSRCWGRGAFECARIVPNGTGCAA